jgi:uncharacterized protein with FMN-binding domain
MAPSPSNKKVANSLVSLSSAAILAVYTAGFMKTRASAQRIEEASNERRPVMPAPATAGERTTPAPIEPPAPIAKPVTGISAGAPKGTPSEPSAKSPAVAVKVTKTAEAPKPKPVATPAAALTPAAETSAPTTSVAADPPVTTEKAEAPVTAPAPTPALKMPKETYVDGTYLGWGTSRHGDIQASIKIEGGRFVAASIAQCWTRYSCSWVAHLPPQVVARQSPDVDYVSGATESANAFYWAIVDALKKAK